MNWDIVRTPRFWAVVLPPLLALWAGMSLFKMFDERQALQRTAEDREQAMKDARQILSVRQEGGEGNVGVRPPFTPVTSAFECARKAGIQDSRVSRGESSSPSSAKDGGIEVRENYNLTGVRIMQLVAFIDHAETAFADVNCTQINLTPIRTGGLDNWDVSIELRYVAP